MSKAYTRNVILLLLVAFIALGMENTLMFAPLIGVIQSLSTDTKFVSSSGSIWAIITVVVLAVLLSTACVVFTARGIARDRNRKWLWIALLILSILLLLQALVLGVAAPSFHYLIKDLAPK